MLYAALRSLSRRTQIKDKGEEYRAGKGMSLHSLMTFRNEYILLLPMYIS